jgi:hypothetical protein
MAGELQAAVVPLVARILGARIVATPDWLQRPAAAECGSAWEKACQVYAELTGLTLPEAMPPRERRRVDAVLEVDGHRRILEMDETQPSTVSARSPCATTRAPPASPSRLRRGSRSRKRRRALRAVGSASPSRGSFPASTAAIYSGPFATCSPTSSHSSTTTHRRGLNEPPPNSIHTASAYGSVTRWAPAPYSHR